MRLGARIAALTVRRARTHARPTVRRAVSKAEAERKAKEAEEAAATGGRPSHRAPAKKADAEGGSKKSPAELEVEKLDKILEVAAKTGEFNYAADAAKADE